MPHLILVKHSLPQIVLAIPAREWSLSPAGRARCQPLAARLAAYSPDRVISSIEPKAVETAQIVAQEIHKPSRIQEGLHEHDRTGVEFLDRETFEARVAEFFKHPNELVLGRETARQAQERFSKALESVTAGHPNENLVVVSHGTVITLFVEKITGQEPFSLWKRLGLPSFVVFSLPGYELSTVVEKIV